MRKTSDAHPNQEPFVLYDEYSRKLLVGSKAIVNFINHQLMESPIHYMTYIRTYRPRLREAGVIRRDAINNKDVAVPYLLAKYWEEKLLEKDPDRGA